MRWSNRCFLAMAFQARPLKLFVAVEPKAVYILQCVKKYAPTSQVPAAATYARPICLMNVTRS
jgi:hypothetical protein